MDEGEIEKSRGTKMLLDGLSPSFCTVKWKHATLNLGSGAVKSCCHLPFRKVQLDNRAQGLELHDTAEDRLERAMMLKGEKPKDCSYCWWIEDKGYISDRISWSGKNWMAPYTESIYRSGGPAARSPSWLELNFSNVCNLKCSYCSPIFSTKWLQEINEFGPYPTDPGHNDVNYLQGVELNTKFDNTELMKEFWPWFEKAYPEVRLLKLTGGEPFLSPATFKLLNWILENPNSKLGLSINSNLTVPESTWTQFMDLIIKIRENKSVEEFYLHPSIDTFGARAEYIRHGLKFQTLQNHVADYLERAHGNLIFICTINNLALGGLKEFWQYLLQLKKQFGSRGQWVSVTSEVLMGPEWQSINILPAHFQNYLQETIDFVQPRVGTGPENFSEFELQGLTRALNMMKTPPADLERAQKNFYRFFSEHDRRRGTHLLEVFPEMREFWHHCGTLAMGEGAVIS